MPGTLFEFPAASIAVSVAGVWLFVNGQAGITSGPKQYFDARRALTQRT